MTIAVQGRANITPKYIHRYGFGGEGLKAIARKFLRKAIPFVKRHKLIQNVVAPIAKEVVSPQVYKDIATLAQSERAQSIQKKLLDKLQSGSGIRGLGVRNIGSGANDSPFKQN